MNYLENLVLQISFIIVPIIAYAVVSKSVFSGKRRAVLGVVLAFLGAFGAWYVCGYQAPHPFLTMMHGPMNPDLVFVWMFVGLLAMIALVAFIFGGGPREVAPNQSPEPPQSAAH